MLHTVMILYTAAKKQSGEAVKNRRQASFLHRPNQKKDKYSQRNILLNNLAKNKARGKLLQVTGQLKAEYP